MHNNNKAVSRSIETPLSLHFLSFHTLASLNNKDRSHQSQSNHPTTYYLLSHTQQIRPNVWKISFSQRHNHNIMDASSYQPIDVVSWLKVVVGCDWLSCVIRVTDCCSAICDNFEHQYSSFEIIYTCAKPRVNRVSQTAIMWVGLKIFVISCHLLRSFFWYFLFSNRRAALFAVSIIRQVFNQYRE